MDRLRTRRRDRGPGQVLIIVALMFPVLIGMVGLGVDTGNVVLQRRQMQAAADIAALSGSIDLPDSPSNAMAAALANTSTNGYPSGVTAIAPYDGDSSKIEVVISAPVDTYFMGLFGVNSVNVSARAVAINDVGTTALFAGKDTCGSNNHEAIHWSGSTSAVDSGDVHSNSGMKISGSDNDLGATTYHCTLEHSGSNNAFHSGPTQSAQKPWPVSFATSDFTPCTYGSLTSGGDFDLSANGAWWVGGTKSSKQLNPGVYCSREKLVLSDTGIQGNVTFVSLKWVHVSGSDFNLTPFKHGVLLFSNGSDPDAVKISGSGGSYEGLLYAPNGQVDISGSSNFSVNGTIVAWTIKLSGSDWHINGTLEHDRAIQLIE